MKHNTRADNILGLFFDILPGYKKPDATELHTDMHMHLLPGLDDGSANMQESLQLVRALAGFGYQKCIVTPHIYDPVYKNSVQQIESVFHTFQSATQDAGIEMELQFAAEYYIDDAFPEQYPGFQGLLPIYTNHILIETGLHVRPAQFERNVFDMQLAGLQPVLAHPERYAWLFEKQNLAQAEHYREAGILFQCNIMSFSGLYGEGPKKYARKLADAGYVDLLGSDLHTKKQLPFLENALCDKYVIKLIRSHTLLNSKL